jgi:DNA-binding NarL/FixJ family response regulator
MRMKLLVADRYRLVLLGLHAVLDGVGDIEVVGETHCAEEVLPLVRRLKPDVLLVDLWLCGEYDGPGSLESLRNGHTAVKLIVLGPDGEPGAVADVLARGAHGYIVDSIELDDLVGAIRTAAAGPVAHALRSDRPSAPVSSHDLERVTHRQIVESTDLDALVGSIGGEGTGRGPRAPGFSRPRTSRSSPELDGLTDRELVVLRAVARGLSNSVIGEELWVTQQTVKFHLTNIYRKLKVGNRTEATRAAFRLGVVEGGALNGGDGLAALRDRHDRQRSSPPADGPE